MDGRTSLLDRLHAFKQVPLLAWPLALGNLAAVYYGWFDYYRVQFDETPTYFWPFVSDSPNAVLVFAAALILFQFRVRHALLDLFAWVVNIKVGLWTVFILSYYYDEYFDHEARLRWILLWLHVGMIAQAFALHRDLRTKTLPRWVFATVAGWVLLGDVLDYTLRLHPSLPGSTTWIPPYVYPTATAVVTFGITIATLTMALALYGRPRREKSIIA